MQNNNIVQMSPRQCFLVPYFMILTMYVTAIFSDIDKTVSIVLISILSIFPIIFLLWSFPKKIISIGDARKYGGILGPYNAIVASVFLSLHWGKSLKEILLILSVLILFCIIVTCLMEVFYMVRKAKKNNDNNRNKMINPAVPISGLGAFGGIIGMFLSRYLRQKNIDITFEIIFILIWLFSLVSYSAFIKNRSPHSCKTEYQNKD